jgi:hypothetical protein
MPFIVVGILRQFAPLNRDKKAKKRAHLLLLEPQRMVATLICILLRSLGRAAARPYRIWIEQG